MVDVRPPSVLFGDLVPATFIERPNRFIAHVEIAGKQCCAHVADPGRLTELLIPGRTVHVKRFDDMTKRTTRCQVVLAEQGTNLVCIDTRVPNQLIGEALRQKAIPRFASYMTVKAEAKHGRSRFDFHLSDPVGGHPDVAWVEVKSVSLRRDRTGWFPDAPTTRGARHVRELASLRRDGIRAGIIFLVQRDDVDEVRPERDMDPAFGDAIDEAMAAGVEIVAFRSVVTTEGTTLGQEVPFRP